MKAEQEIMNKDCKLGKNPFFIELKFPIWLAGVGPSKKIAKKNAAAALMQYLENGGNVLDECSIPMKPSVTASNLLV